MTAAAPLAEPGATPDSVSGVAVVVPTYRQVDDLHRTVEGFLDALGAAGVPHTVVVVDDASDDATAAEAEWLGRERPEHVIVVRHDRHRGYGASTRTGIAAALAGTDHPAVLLTDACSRVSAATVVDFLVAAADERAEVVLGRRPGRPRSVRGVVAGLLVGSGRARPRDPDCAFRLVDRHVLEEMELTADGRALGPELLARAHQRGARVVERSVEEEPPPVGPAAAHRHGRASLRELLRVRRTGRVGRRRPRDPVGLAVTVGAVLVSVLALRHFLAADAVLTYPDAVAHQLIARRVLESPTPGIAQIGAVWLPLPSLLSLPLIGVDGLYLNGVGAAVVSMAAYVLTTRYLYALVHELTGRRVAGVVAALVFASCPNVLYLQSTSMTELPFLCGLAGATYHLTRWSRTGRHAHLAMAALLALLATLTRYEAWVFTLAMVGVVVVVAWRRTEGGLRAHLRHVEAHVVYFGLIAFAGIAGWLLWNAVIFGDVTFFYDGQFAKVALLPEDVADGSWTITLRTYWYAVVDNIGVPLAVVGGVALVAYLARTRLRGPFLAAATPVVLLPFFLWFLWSGSRPLRVMEISGSRYNVRFGLVMIIPVAILVGFLVAELCRLLRDRRGWATGALAGALVVVAAIGVAQRGTATLEEAIGFRATPQEQANSRAGTWLRMAYTGGPILMDTPGNETVVGDGRLSTRDVVYDGNATIWQQALADPARRGIDWIFMRGNVGGGGSVGGLADQPDRVWTSLVDTPELAGYALVYDADDRRIYHRVGAP